MTSAPELHLRVNALLRDTAALHTAAGLGFVVDKNVVDAFVAGFDAAAWFVVDARATDGDACRTQLVRALDAARPIALVVGARPPLPALSFAQSLAERTGVADLGNLITHPIRASVSVVVCVDGIDDYAGLPRQFQRIDFWEFLS